MHYILGYKVQNIKPISIVKYVNDLGINNIIDYDHSNSFNYNLCLSVVNYGEKNDELKCKMNMNLSEIRDHYLTDTLYYYI